MLLYMEEKVLYTAMLSNPSTMGLHVTLPYWIKIEIFRQIPQVCLNKKFVFLRKMRPQKFG